MAAEQEKEWFYMSLGHRRGPVTKDEVCRMISKQEVYIDSTQVWKNGMTQWVKLADVKDFAPAIKKLKKEVADLDARVRDSSTHEGAEGDFISRGVSRPFFNLYFYLGWLVPMLVGVFILTELQVFQLIDPMSIERYWWLLHLPVFLVLFVTCQMCGYRMENVGYSRFQGLGLLLPLYNLWILFTCLFAPNNFRRRKKMGLSMLLYIFLFLGVGTVLSPAVLPKLKVAKVSPLAVNEMLQTSYKKETHFEARYKKRAAIVDEEKEQREKQNSNRSEEAAP